jgi:hypothetical protein
MLCYGMLCYSVGMGTHELVSQGNCWDLHADSLYLSAEPDY